jgi:lipid II isoglutaminyl synthase (glutamine-hydrolysing)
MSGDTELSIVLVYPELLGTYGDRGNALALVRRAGARQLATRVVEVSAGETVPSSGDVYLIGGGEDAALALAWESLGRGKSLCQALDGGAACLAVCAGLQLLSASFTGPDGAVRTGLGALDVRCRRLPGRRAVGEVVADCVGLPGLPQLTGFENHQGDAELGPAARPLGRVLVGTGNGGVGDEGAVQGNVVATYLHGPVLVRNPALADYLLSRSAGPLAPFADESVDALRRERLQAAFGAQHRPWSGPRGSVAALSPGTR